MNYRTDIVNFLRGRAVILKLLLSGGSLIREWALITSFMVVGHIVIVQKSENPFLYFLDFLKLFCR